MKKFSMYADLSTQWAEAIRSVKSVAELISIAKEWGKLTSDALAVVEKMSEEEFIEFKEGLLSEQRGVFAGEAWGIKYSQVFMPNKLVDITIMACNLKVPEGVVYNRMIEEKMI